MFGCNPVGSSGYSCGCPRGYEGLGRDSCLAVGGGGGFFGGDEGDGHFEYLEEGRELDEDVVSSEGCFACKMGRDGSGAASSSSSYSERSKKSSHSSSRAKSRRRGRSWKLHHTSKSSR